MKQIKLFLMAIVAVLLLASCSKSDYLKVIPKDVSLVGSVNIKSLSDKTSLADSPEFKKIIDMLVEQIKENNEHGEDLASYFEDPTNLGIDFREPVYYFMTNDLKIGVVMKLLSSDDFKGLLANLEKFGAPQVEEKDGLNIFDLEKCRLYFNDESLLFLCNVTGGTGMLDKTAKQLFAQEQSESFLEAEGYDLMTAGTNDGALFVNMAVMNLLPGTNFDKTLKDTYGKDINAEDLNVVMTFLADDGKAVIETSMIAATDAAKKLIEDQRQRKIAGTFIDKAPENCLLWAASNVDGEKVLDQLKKNKDIKDMLNMIGVDIDIEKLVKSFDGDMTVCMPADFMSDSDSENYFGIFAEVGDETILSDLSSVNEMLENDGWSLEEGDDCLNLMYYGDAKATMRVDGKELCLCSPYSLDYWKNAGSNSKIKDMASEIKDSYVFLYVDLTTLPMEKLFGLKDTGVTVLNQLGLQSLKMVSKDENSVKLELTLADDSSNILKQIADAVMGFASEFIN